MPKSPDSSSTFDFNCFSEGHSLCRSLFPYVPSRFVSFFCYFVYFLSDALFQELPLCHVALASFLAPSVGVCLCPSWVSFFLLLFPLTYTCSCFRGPVHPSFIVPMPYAVSPPLLTHPRQPPSPSPDLCALCTWPC